MCLTWPQEIFSLRTILKLICTLLTCFLLIQELYTFVVTKPTLTFIEEKKLEVEDLPEVVICLEPGFDNKVLEKYGYKDHYSRGLMNGKFIGWNGKENETKASGEILEEALILKHQQIGRTKIITSAKYRDGNQNFFPTGINFMGLSWPYGRCFSISPPPIEVNMTSSINTLYLNFNKAAFKRMKDMFIKIFFMDKTNSLKIYPNDMAGDLIRVSMNDHRKFTYKTKISRTQHVLGDPLLKCSEYTLKNSYSDCTIAEIHGSFHDILDCVPPLLGNDPKTMCNERLNITKSKELKMDKIFQLLYIVGKIVKNGTDRKFKK